jgi:bacterioferritin (cytochrome b1)
MTLDDLIKYLNQDLAREYAHWHFYINAAVRVTGLPREEYQEFFEKEAAGEMQHIQEFAKLILGLGGIPTTTPAHYAENLSDPTSLLQEALRMEEEVVNQFVGRMDQADELEINGGQDRVNGRYVHIFLEEQMMDSRQTVDHLREILKNAPSDPRGK